MPWWKIACACARCRTGRAERMSFNSGSAIISRIRGGGVKVRERYSPPGDATTGSNLLIGT